MARERSGSDQPAFRLFFAADNPSLGFTAQTALRPVMSSTIKTITATTRIRCIKFPTAAPANPNPNAHNTKSMIIIVQSIVIPPVSDNFKPIEIAGMFVTLHTVGKSRLGNRCPSQCSTVPSVRSHTLKKRPVHFRHGAFQK